MQRKAPHGYPGQVHIKTENPEGQEFLACLKRLCESEKPTVTKSHMLRRLVFAEYTRRFGALKK